MSDSSAKSSVRLSTSETPDLQNLAVRSLQVIAKSAAGKAEGSSNATVQAGRKEHLINKYAARDKRKQNATHGICLDAKITASVGPGHRSGAIYDALDPLCTFGWQDVLDAAGEDLAEGADGFIEVAYNDEGHVQRLTHIDATQVHVEVPDPKRPHLFHYVVTGGMYSEELVMAQFGDLAALQRRSQPEQRDPGSPTSRPVGGKIVDSELIHFRRGTNASAYYGDIDYHAAMSAIELSNCMMQHEFDFYFNRGVPELIMFIKGNVAPEIATKLENLIKANQGPGNSRKSGVVTLTGNPESIEIQIERLGIEGDVDSGFSDKNDTLSGLVATAHGVPAGLANLILSGKIGANNETLNMMLLFQKRKIGLIQRHISCVLAQTLGSAGVLLASPTGSPVSLSADQFYAKGIPEAKKSEMGGMVDDNDMPIFHEGRNGFRTLLDGMTLGAQQTLATQKEQQVGSSRDPGKGTLSSGGERKGPKPSRTA